MFNLFSKAMTVKVGIFFSETRQRFEICSLEADIPSMRVVEVPSSLVERWDAFATEESSLQVTLLGIQGVGYHMAFQGTR